MNRWVYIFFCCLAIIGALALRNYFVLQTSDTLQSSSSAPDSSQSLGQVSQSSANTFQAPQTQNLPSATGNSLPQPAQGNDPTISKHTLPSGGRADIVPIGQIVASQQQAYTGDDITFTITIQNVASYKKFVRQLCWQSTEGNFGCSPGFNLDPGQVFTISNNGRFESSGTKSIWVTWTQDNTNYYSPVDSSSATVQIL